MDFSSILGGTIDGRVEYAVTRGSVIADHLEKAVIVLMRPPDHQDFRSVVISGWELCR